MRTYALSLAILLASLSGCTQDGDYQVAVSWLINGTTPTPDLCAEQRVDRARFEVRSAGGKRVKTVESRCADTIFLNDDNEYGGFLSTVSFDWDTQYYFTLTLVDAVGAPISVPWEGQFRVGDDTDIKDLPYLDFVEPKGTAAGLTGQWSVRTGDLATEESCRAADIGTVRIFATSALDEGLLDAKQVAEVPCASGSFVSQGKILARGFYVFFFEAYSRVSPDVLVHAGRASAPFLVDGSKDVALAREIFLSTTN